MSIEATLILTTVAVVVAVGLSAFMMMRDRRIRNNVRRAQLAARVSAFEVIAFELGKVAGYEQQPYPIVDAVSPEERRAMRAAYDEAKLDLIDWVQETFKFDRARS